MLKLLLIDDEKTVLNGICYMLKKYYSDFVVVDAVQDASKGLDVLKEKSGDINLVITDVCMPQMNGIKFVELVKEQFPDIQTIVLSAYSDYAYVREALQLGAFDYLLKPCSPKDFVAALDKVKTLLSEGEVSVKKEKIARILEKNILSETDLSDLIAPDTTAQMILIKTDENTNRKETTADVFASWIREKKLCKTSINLSIKGHRVFLLDRPVTITDLNRLLNKWDNTTDFWASKEFAYNPGNLQQCYKICLRMLDMAEFNNYRSVIDEALWATCQKERTPFEERNYFLNEDFKRFFLTGDPSPVFHGIDTKIQRTLSENRLIDPTGVKKDLLTDLLSIEDMLEQRQINMEDVVGRKVDFFYELNRLRDKKALINWFRNLCEAIIRHDDCSEKTPVYIRDAMEYIERHYMKNLELKEIANHVFLNEWYFSTQFKKHMGVSFSEYLNQVRIKHAKILLAHKDMKISHVAKLVGFQDQAYFSLVFKRFVDISPKRYQISILKRN